MATDPSEKLARLRELERLEREERRGLEVRATGSIAGLLIVAGLALNARALVDPVILCVAALALAVAVLLNFFPLIGLHATTDEPTLGTALRAAIVRSKPPAVPVPLDDLVDELAVQEPRVQRLLNDNAAAVVALRLAALASMLAVWMLLVAAVVDALR